MPAERIGVVVLTNQGSGNPVPTMIVRTLYDRLLGVEPADWAARQRKADAEAAARRDESRRKLLATRKDGTSPSHALQAYAGTFTHPGYGDLVVRRDGATLVITLAPHEARLQHFHYDVWEIQDPGGVVPFGGLLRFETDPNGDVTRVLVPLEPAVAPIEFVRK